LHQLALFALKKQSYLAQKIEAHVLYVVVILSHLFSNSYKIKKGKRLFFFGFLWSLL